MTNVHIRQGDTRNGFTLCYHEIFDLYHPYIGDKATLYYLYLLRYRNTDTTNDRYGKSWNGRAGIIEKFQLSYSTLPLLDAILEASGLIELESVPSGRGRDKIIYIVHDPVERQRFRDKEEAIVSALRQLVELKPKAMLLLGKENKAKLTDM